MATARSSIAAKQITASGMSVCKIGGRIGALIEGIRLGGHLSTDEVAAIRQAVLQHKVVFLRNQAVKPTDLEAFAEGLGEPVPYNYSGPAQGQNNAWEFDEGTRSDHWHHDLSWHLVFPSLEILSPLTLPEFGGDTVWANTASAYQMLPAPLREMADKLWAVHSAKGPLELKWPSRSKEDARAIVSKFRDERTGTRHPVVHVHPETGERALILGNIYYIEGFIQSPGQHLYELLQFYITHPDNTLRWRWELGDVAIWDNRTTQHFGVYDYDRQKRVMQRVSLKGELLRSIDGIPSSEVP